MTDYVTPDFHAMEAKSFEDACEVARARVWRLLLDSVSIGRQWVEIEGVRAMLDLAANVLSKLSDDDLAELARLFGSIEAAGGDNVAGRESNRARVRRLLFDPLGMRHKSGTDAAGQKSLDAVADAIGHLTDLQLDAVRRLVAPFGQGSARNFYPDRATFIAWAHVVDPRPLFDDPRLAGWFASVEGPRMVAEGTLVESWEFFERHHRPPSLDLDRHRVWTRASENQSRALRIEERIARGLGVDPGDRFFVTRYRFRQEALARRVDLETAKKQRT